MAPTFAAAGAIIFGTTSLALPYPSPVTAGQKLLLFVANKYPTNGPAQPGGWNIPSGNQYSGGAGVAGADSGAAYITVFERIADGTETGNVTVTLTGSNTAGGRILSFNHNGGGWDTDGLAGGADNTNGTAWSVTAGANPGVTAGDLVIVASAPHGNIMTFTVEAITQTGVTFGAMVERQDSGTNNGDDVSLCITEHPVSSGTGSAAPVYTGTNSNTLASGPSLFYRLRALVAADDRADKMILAEMGLPGLMKVSGG